MASNLGQINLGTEFGNAIYSISKHPYYTRFCEVGTWNGCGSTRCLYEGIRGRDAVLYSIEGDITMYNQASQVWRGTSNVNLLYGTLHRNILPRDVVLQHPLFNRVSEHYSLWYDTEKRAVENTPLVSVPPCDVILLDGGEFSTQGDWEVLQHPDLRVVILDDTQIMKTNSIYRSLREDSSWKCLYDRPSDRNGWAIFEHI